MGSQNLTITFTVTLNATIETDADNMQVKPTGILVTAKCKEKYDGDIAQLAAGAELAASTIWRNYAAQRGKKYAAHIIDLNNTEIN